MLEPDELRRDRRRFHAHTALFLVGFAGWIFVAKFEALFVKAFIPWILVGLSLLMTASGVLAILIKRTFISGPAEDVDPSAPYGDQGDALATPGLHTLDLWPAYTRSGAPFALLAVALALLALSCYWALGGMP